MITGASPWALEYYQTVIPVSNLNIYHYWVNALSELSQVEVVEAIESEARESGLSESPAE